MGFAEGCKELIKKGDFFNSYQLLRYQKETEYRTFTGGIISIGIIITIVLAFASMILDTINRATINFTANSQRNIDPTLSIITTSPEANFMFGVQVWGYNLSSQKRLFDVAFTQISSNYGDNYTSTNYTLEACTEAHWSMLPDVINSFDRLSIGNWLCPSIGTIIKLQGKYSSEFYHQYSITLYPCNNGTDPSRPCGSPEDISQFFIEKGQWNYFTYYYANSIVNPDQPQYKSYYLEDRTYIVFGQQLGAELDMYLNEIDIETDSSIWPFEDMSSDKIYSTNFNPILYPFSVNSNTSFATFYVMKDPTQISYSRAVEKIFVVFSFMGGLIGAVMAALFIVNSYTSFAYQLALALQIFKKSDYASTHQLLKQEPQHTINLLHYFQYYIFLILDKIKGNIEWSFAKYIHECREQITAQLDIKKLINRVIFLEYAISYVLEDYHLSQMQLKRPVKPSQIKALREKIQAQQPRSETQSQRSKQVDPLYQPSNAIQKESPSLENNNKLGQTSISSRKKNIFMSDIYSEGSNEVEFASNCKVDNIDKQISARRGIIKKRTFNLKKLKESANQGNLISKKLLLVINRQNEDEICQNQCQNNSNVDLINKNTSSISKFLQQIEK